MSTPSKCSPRCGCRGLQRPMVRAVPCVLLRPLAVRPQTPGRLACQQRVDGQRMTRTPACPTEPLPWPHHGLHRTTAAAEAVPHRRTCRRRRTCWTVREQQHDERAAPLLCRCQTDGRTHLDRRSGRRNGHCRLDRGLDRHLDHWHHDRSHWRQLGHHGHPWSHVAPGTAHRRSSRRRCN